MMMMIMIMIMNAVWHFPRWALRWSPFPRRPEETLQGLTESQREKMPSSDVQDTVFKIQNTGYTRRCENHRVDYTILWTWLCVKIDIHGRSSSSLPVMREILVSWRENCWVVGLVWIPVMTPLR